MSNGREIALVAALLGLMLAAASDVLGGELVDDLPAKLPLTVEGFDTIDLLARDVADIQRVVIGRGLVMTACSSNGCKRFKLRQSRAALLALIEMERGLVDTAKRERIETVDGGHETR
jgi:hypothetical protein